MVDKLRDYEGVLGRLHTWRSSAKKRWLQWKDCRTHSASYNPRREDLKEDFSHIYSASGYALGGHGFYYRLVHRVFSLKGNHPNGQQDLEKDPHVASEGVGCCDGLEFSYAVGDGLRVAHPAQDRGPPQAYELRVVPVPPGGVLPDPGVGVTQRPLSTEGGLGAGSPHRYGPWFG
uniref:Uncharacterized protein n=1 Tax=Timema monikensis TaxID=170555 RepID=A0A7R9ELL1_9NEOP|nr:unnamed protein product [Timema monikensis]